MAYASLADVKAYLKLTVTDTADDALITSLVARAQAAIDSYKQRTFEALSDTERTFDAVRDVDGAYLSLDADLCAVTSITNGDGTTVTTGQYVTDPRNGTPYFRIKLLSSSGVAWTYTTDPEDAISVVGKWAYSATAPADIVQACVRWAAHMYRQKDSSTFETTVYPNAGIIERPMGMPADVKMLLGNGGRRITT